MMIEENGKNRRDFIKDEEKLNSGSIGGAKEQFRQFTPPQIDQFKPSDKVTEDWSSSPTTVNTYKSIESGKGNLKTTIHPKTGIKSGPLSTILSAPATTGTTYSVITDSNGQLSFDSSPTSNSETPKIRYSTLYESNLRIRDTVAGSGTAVYPTASALTTLVLDTVGGVTSASHNAWNPLVAGYAPRGATVGMTIRLTGKGTDGASFFGLAELAIRTLTGGNLIDYTLNHIGFKITWASSGVASLYATVANGTTETASSALSTIALNDRIELIFVCNDTNPVTTVSFYWRVNEGDLSSATIITTNLPANNTDYITAMVGNENADTQNSFAIANASYER